MRIRRLSQAQGSAILTVLFIGTALSVMVAGYMALVRGQSTSVSRSTSWNSCLAIAEAGIEEAMTQLYYCGITNLSANQWTLMGGEYTKQRAIGNCYYFVAITNFVVNGTEEPDPIVRATGYVPISHKGTVTNYLSRTVQVRTERRGLFVKAMVAKGQIDFNGNNTMSDSFDSSDPAYSKAGQYDPAKSKDNGDVATNSGLVNSVDVGNANIFGHVSTGPHGTVAIGWNGAVGSKIWQATHSGESQEGWVTDDMNVFFPDIEVPYVNGDTNLPKNVKIGNDTYAIVLGNGNYTTGPLTLKASEILYVNGNAKLYVTGDISITGSASIEIGPKGSLELYMAGNTATFAGNGIANTTGKAMNFIYLGLPSNRILSFQGNADFVGSIYAPNADFDLGGGGNSGLDFIGASVSNTVTMKGHFRFHYDEALGKSKWGGPFRVASWDEL